MKELRNSILCVVLVIATLSLSMLMVRPSYAQSTEPSIPKFSIQTPNTSTIQLVIENQAFTNSSSVNSLVYYYRVKAHNSDTWMIDGDYTLQSNSDITIISIPPEPGIGTFLNTPMFQNSTLLDFQVQAVTGFYNVTWEQGYMGSIPQAQPGYWQISFNPAESSAWSPTQTVTLPANLSTGLDSSSTSTSTSPSPILTRTPLLQTPAATALPRSQSPSTNLKSSSLSVQESWLAVIPLVAIFFIAVVVRHRKTANLKKETSC